MISFKKFILPSLFGVAAMAMCGILDGIPFIESLIDFLSTGSDASLAFAAIAGVGAVATTAESATPAGTTVVSTDTEGEGANYLDDDLNPTIVKIRPQDTPIDTITRMIGNTEKSESWEAGGWEIGTREITDTVTVDAGAGTITGTGDMWLVGDTLLLVNDETGAVLDSKSEPISCIIKSKSGNTLTVQRIGASTNTVMPTEANAAKKALRLSRAVSELTASVAGFAIQPTDRKYFNQIHMCQVEESVIHALHKKKVSMDFTTYKEQTLWDFKRGMEFANLFQVGGLAKDNDGQLVHLATGIWWQINEQSTYNPEGMDDAAWNALGKDIFEGNNGSDRRFLLAGPEFMLAISKVHAYAKQLEAKNTEVVLGVRVYKIETPFGELLVKPMGTLFEGYFSKCAMVVDANYIKKFVMEPLTATVLELDKTGQRRVKNAVRMHETYSLFLENLPVHRKIVPQEYQE